ncbi:MAG: MotA/TolQ/ExbB proton channel family protein, partial [Bacteroidales bacterium]|nr:MotA/TolQ/ExbB proton channel family protein [Bacteroidales bacterium]
MKKFFMFLAVAGALTLSANINAAAQNEPTSATEVVTSDDAANPFAAAKSDQPLHQALKAKFIEGGAGFMATVLLCLIFGLAIAIERIITLSLAQTNNKKLLNSVEEALAKGDVEAAKEVCRNTRGPVASIFYQGLLRMDQGVENVEKAVVSYGSVQMA